jgi:multidrug resistance efflux pump
MSSAWTVGVTLDTGQPELAMQVLLLVSGLDRIRAKEICKRLALVRDVPQSYAIHNARSGAESRAENLASTMDLLVLINREKRFRAAAMVLCNELAVHYHCSRVSLGWKKGDYVRLQAMSHADKFEKKMDAVADLEKTMEECLDQDEEVVSPRPDGASFISRDHDEFARLQGAGAVCSVPLRDGELEVEAVLTLERESETFTLEHLNHLRLCADQVMPPLHDLYRRDRWIGSRLAASTRNGLSKVFGVKHTWTKLLCVIVAGVIAFLSLYRTEFRVEAPFTVKSRDVAYVSAPYDGYLEKASVVIGQRVGQGDMVFRMDTQDLLLERSNARAELNRYRREQEKARGEGELAEMRIAASLVEQSRIEIEALNYRLGRADVKAPIDGIVVRAGDGASELHERLHAPLSRGDAVMKIARLSNLYVECRVDERDIEHIADSASGEIAFASQPDLKFGINLETLDPSAMSGQEGSYFVAQSEFAETPQGWFRPGMTGIAKINSGERSLIWIFTHRTVDFLRLLFWW